MNLALLIEEAAEKFGPKTVLITENQRIGYAELNNAANAIAHALRREGIEQGDKVALMLPNIPEFVYTYFAAAKIGAVAVPLNPSSTAHELAYLLENSEAKVFITAETARKRFDEISNKLTSCQKIIAVDSNDADSCFKKALALGPFSNPAAVINPEDPAVIIYTSGLTGKPLGAVLTHHNLYSQSSLLADIAFRTDKDKGISLIPLFHSFGATANMIAVLPVGLSVAMMDRFKMDIFFSTLEKEKITYICAVPRLYMGMIFYEGAAKYDLSSLEVCVTGGAPMPPEFIPAFEKQFGAKILEGYGLTEASPVCSFTRVGMQQKPGSIGVAIPGTMIKIVDDQGREKHTGEIGELVIKGDNVMKGYYKDEAATASVIKNGWLYTGDLGKMDEDGYIFLTGRKKRMIITSGFNVYPREVESVLNLHPAVETSRVVAQPDLMRGEIVKAQIVRKEGLVIDDKEILKHCRAYLSSYKVPREVEFVTEINDET